MRISKETIGLVAIATFCFLGLSLYLDIFYYTFDLNNTGDSLSYKEAAKMLFYGAKAHPTRPIGIAFFFGFLERIHPILITVVQFLLWIGTILVLNKSISLIANKRISFILCLIFILCFSHILYIHLELTETITTFLLTLTSYFILKYTKAHSFKNLAYASAILLFMVLIKPGFYYVSLILTLYTFWKLIRAKISLRIAIPILFALALLALNNAMVYKSYGKFKPSFIDDVTLYTYLGAYSETEVRNTSTARIQRERREEMKHLSYLEINEISKKDLQFQMQYHPFVVLKYWVINIKNNATGGSIILPSLSDLQNQKGGNNMLYGLSQIQNILMVILSLILPIYFLLRRRKLDYFIIATSFLIWYILLTSGISYFQGDRFHLVFYPLVLMQVAFILFKKKATNIA